MADDNAEDIPEDLGEDDQSVQDIPAADDEGTQSTTAMPEKSSTSIKEKSQTAIKEKSTTSMKEKSEMALKGKSTTSVKKDKSGAIEPGSSTMSMPVEPPEPEPEPEPVYIEPLGEVTEEGLLDHDMKPFILDKMFHEGRMSRFHSKPRESIRPGDEGNALYEDYKWQLDKLFRQVPENMSLGNVRLKPDELLYEGEKFVLGKFFRSLREDDGYIPTAEKEESLLDLSEAIDVTIPPLKEPRCPGPVYPQESSDNMKCIQVEDLPDDRCTRGANPTSGKVYEFTYSPVMAVEVDPGASGGCCEEAQPDCPQSRPVTPYTPSGEAPPDNGNAPVKACPSVQTCGAKASPSTKTIAGGCPSSKTVSGRTCRNNLRCESNIEAVCNAARSAMAIYDTLTGCDNFPCNIGDRPEAELENVEETVWSWLYQIILKLVPKDYNQNEQPMLPTLNVIPEESPSETIAASESKTNQLQPSSSKIKQANEECIEDC